MMTMATDHMVSGIVMVRTQGEFLGGGRVRAGQIGVRSDGGRRAGDDGVGGDSAAP